MYLKELSSVKDTDNEYFRYENWEDYTSIPDFSGKKIGKALKENLTLAFKDIESQAITEFGGREPDIAIEFDYSWYECAKGECVYEDRDCDRCSHYKEGKTCFVAGDAEPGEGNVLVPIDLIGHLIKSISSQEWNYPFFCGELFIKNIDTGDVVIYCDDVTICSRLTLEIDTTEIEAVKKVLKRLELLD